MSLLTRITSIAQRAGPIVNTLAGLTALGSVAGVQRIPPPATMPGRLTPLPGVGTPGGGGFRTGGTLQPMTNGQQCLSGYHYAKDGSGRLVRNRRMNPLNPSAARRAIRRIKSLRKICSSIEKQMPTRTVYRSRK